MNFYGVLVDASTGEAVPGATIAGGAGAVRGITTDNGQFNFSADPLDVVITFSKVGYYPASYASIQMSGSPGAVLEIIPGSAETLPPVIVTPAVKWILGTAAVAALVYYGTKK